MIQTQANNTLLKINPTTGADVDLCAALDITAKATQTWLSITGTAADALVATASGAIVSVATDGVVLASCAGSVFAGRLVKAVASSDAIENLGSQVIPASAEDSSIAGNIAGRAYTAGASGGFAVVHIK